MTSKWRLRHRESKSLSKDYIASKWQSQDLNPGALTLKSTFNPDNEVLEYKANDRTTSWLFDGEEGRIKVVSWSFLTPK